MKARLLLCASLLASACAGPRPEAPQAAQVAPPAQWRDGTATGATEIGDRWWSAFGDPALDAVVEQALARNVDIAIAAARVEEARAQFALAEAQRLPALTGTAAGNRQRALNPFGMDVDQTAGQVQASIAWDTDLFGRLRAASGAARANLLATQAAQDAVRLAVAASAAGGYLQLRALDARLLVLRDTLVARENARTLARRRAETGYSPMLDLEQAEADYRATEQLIPQTELAIRRQENGLSLLLGDNPRAIGRGKALAEVGIPTIAASLPSALLRRRPDIAQAEQTLASTDRSLDAARAAFLPQLQLSAAGGAVASSLLSDPASTFSLGGSLLATLFDSGRLEAQQRGAAARRDQAAFAYRRTVLTAFREVEDSLTEVQRTTEQERMLEAQRDAQERTYRHATQRYRAGYSPFLEQLDAQRGLLAAELQLVQVRADRLTATVRLVQALGGGWRAE